MSTQTHICHLCKNELSIQCFSKTQLKKKRALAKCKTCIGKNEKQYSAPLDQNMKSPKVSVPIVCTNGEENLNLSPSAVYDHPSCFDESSESSIAMQNHTASKEDTQSITDECKRLLIKVFVADGKSSAEAVAESEKVLNKYSMHSRSDLLKELQAFKIKTKTAASKHTGESRSQKATEADDQIQCRNLKIDNLREKCSILYGEIFPNISKLKREKKIEKLLRKPTISLKDIYEWLLKKKKICEKGIILKNKSKNSDGICTKVVTGKKRQRQESCDRCDGRHESMGCPYYKKPREDHPDAQRHRYKNIGASRGNVIIPYHKARVKRQPGDGSCLYHAMSFGLRNNTSAQRLRRELAHWVQKNEKAKICDTKVKDWVHWDAGSNVKTYARRMLKGSWGGGIEMAACSRLHNVNVHVYESRGRGYKRK